MTALTGSLSALGGLAGMLSTPRTLPIVSDDDDGKVLMVSDGAWNKVDVPLPYTEQQFFPLGWGMVQTHEVDGHYEGTIPWTAFKVVEGAVAKIIHNGQTYNTVQYANHNGVYGFGDPELTNYPFFILVDESTNTMKIMQVDSGMSNGSITVRKQMVPTNDFVEAVRTSLAIIGE